MQFLNAKKRLIEFIKSTGLGQTAFENKIGISRGSVSNMKDSSGITGKVIEKIKKHYPNVNEAWLLAGVGKMLITDKPKEELPGETVESAIKEAQTPYLLTGKNEPEKTFLEIIKDLSATVKSQQEELRELRSQKGNADGRTAASSA